LVDALVVANELVQRAQRLCALRLQLEDRLAGERQRVVDADQTAIAGLLHRRVLGGCAADCGERPTARCD
jgi:hypothetical protein